MNEHFPQSDEEAVRESVELTNESDRACETETSNFYPLSSELGAGAIRGHVVTRVGRNSNRVVKIKKSPGVRVPDWRAVVIPTIPPRKQR